MAAHSDGVTLFKQANPLTPENHLGLLAEASNKTKLQVQELLARRFPRPDVASYVRKLPSRGACAAGEHSSRAAGQAGEHSPEPHTPITALAPAPGAMSAPSTSPPPTVDSAPLRASIPAPANPTRARIEPTSEARYRIQLNASSSLKEKLELFQALVSHSIPSCDIAAVLERALELALEQVQKQRFAKTDKPRNPGKFRGIKVRSRGSERDHIPNAVQREVATRDGLRCTYVSDGGCRCSARAFLQIHHEQPWARGGTSAPRNLRLLRCGSQSFFGGAGFRRRPCCRAPCHAAQTR